MEKFPELIIIAAIVVVVLVFCVKAIEKRDEVKINVPVLIGGTVYVNKKMTKEEYEKRKLEERINEIKNHYGNRNCENRDCSFNDNRMTKKEYEKSNFRDYHNETRGYYATYGVYSGYDGYYDNSNCPQDFYYDKKDNDCKRFKK